MQGKTFDFDIVREMAAALPDVKESRVRGGPSLWVHGTLLACPAVHRSAEPNSVVVKIAREQRAKLIAEDPDVYYVTDHYVAYSSVLVRLGRIRRDALKTLLLMAWQFAREEAPRRAARKRSSGKRPRAARP